MQRPARADVWLVVLLTASLVIPNATLSADEVAAPSGPPRVVNIRTDSESGWIPSAELERQARSSAMEYLADMDGGRFAEAYARLADINRKDRSFPAFSDAVGQFNTKAGAVIERRITTVTWTKNPTAAPLPGIYAAVDLISRFARVDRHCGYLMLHQAPSGGAFKVMREENNFFDNESAAQIAKQSSPAEVERTWAKVSANCPGYQQAQSAATSPAPLPEAPGPTIDYPTVAAALAGLHAKQGVTFREQAGWTVADDGTTRTIWSFPPADHPAYPSAVKRQLVEENNGVSMKMSVHCEASKQACDELVRTFEQLNAAMAASLRGKK